MDDPNGDQLVFISYRNVDWPFAHRVQERLEPGFAGTVYIDRKINSEDYERELLDKVRRCAVFILIVTPHTLAEQRVARDDDWIRREAALALQLGKPVVLVLFEGHPVPPPEHLPADLRGLVTKQGIKFYADFFDEAVENLRRQCTALAPGVEWVAARPLRTRPRETTQPRRLEAAMPREVAEHRRTEVRVKLSRPTSRGLKGELPAVLDSGDEIAKGDVRRASFPMSFPTDADGRLLPAVLCVSVVAEHYDVEFATYPDSTCDGQAEVELSPTADSRTVIFDLLPKAGDGPSLGPSRVWVRVFHDGRPVAELSLGTTRVARVAEAVYVLSSSTVTLLRSSRPSPPLAFPPASSGPHQGAQPAPPPSPMPARTETPVYGQPMHPPPTRRAWAVWVVGGVGVVILLALLVWLIL